ncbi:TetR family transcriptional regulator [Pseudogracilibacillus sp. SE30717A]|uniref:TetR family transcriptional regulator n=1 Tax=Pseudogracilibacillus sp. SE30717A TaxID=3098293 RepID=UPI00300DEF59
MGKRDAIIQSSINLFKKNGIEQTKISDIVKDAHIAQGTFYLYFPSKLSLMPAIAEEMVKILMQRIRNDVQSDQTIEIKLEQLVDSIFAINEEYSEVMAIIYSGLASTEHLKEWETVYATCYEWVSDLLKDAKENGTIRQSIKPDRTAKLIIGLIESAAEQVFLYDYRDEHEIEIQRKEVVQFLFDALGISKANS